MRKSAAQLDADNSFDASSLDEQITSPGGPPPAPLPFEALVEVLKEGISLGLGNHRRAAFLLANAQRLEREARLYRLQIAGIQAAPGARSGIRLSHLSQTLKRLEDQRDQALSSAEQCLSV